MTLLIFPQVFLANVSHCTSTSISLLWMSVCLVEFNLTTAIQW